MDVVRTLHAQFATVIVLYFAAVGVWGIALGVRGAAPSPGLRGALVIAEIAAVGQGALGLATWLFVRAPSDSVHVLYGIALVLAMPLAATLARDRTARGESIALGLAALFAAGLAIRGMTTG